MREEEAWWLRAKCRNLSEDKADALFFPGSGGKPHKADNYCNTCPVLRICLSEALQSGLPGFLAGTTEQARKHMRVFVAETTRKFLMPPEPDPTDRPIYLAIVKTPEDHSWLEEDIEPSDAVLQSLDALPPVSKLWDLMVG